MITSSDYSNKKVIVTTKSWDERIKENAPSSTNPRNWTTEEGAKQTMYYKYYNDNTEWRFFAFKIHPMTLMDKNEEYSMVSVKMAFKRNHSYYTMTLIIPITVLTILAPAGLILPGKNGLN